MERWSDGSENEKANETKMIIIIKRSAMQIMEANLRLMMVGFLFDKRPRFGGRKKNGQPGERRRGGRVEEWESKSCALGTV